jgi:hypothetical protein
MATDFARMLDLYRFVSAPGDEGDDNAFAPALSLEVTSAPGAGPRPRTPPPWRRGGGQTGDEEDEAERMAEHDRPLPPDELPRSTLDQDGDGDSGGDEGEAHDSHDGNDENDEEEEPMVVRDEPTAAERAQERALRNTLRRLLRAGGGPSTWEHVHRVLTTRHDTTHTTAHDMT